jgi:[ribosomal protein S18]-alanine N-acetyltransferase
MIPISIRLATTEDLPAIGRIQAASPQASQWSPQEYLAYRCTVAELESLVAGFLVSREIAPGEREILNLAVDPAALRNGVGRALLVHELQHSRGQWFLELRASNRKAINLYQSLGFQEVGIRNNYYVSPPESAIVMRIFS